MCQARHQSCLCAWAPVLATPLSTPVLTISAVHIVPNKCCIETTNNLITAALQVRFPLIKPQVMQPRSKETHDMAQPGAKFVYLYDQEPFRVRQKEFWPLPAARKVLAKFISNLSHESDGLILQVCAFSGQSSKGTRQRGGKGVGGVRLVWQTFAQSDCIPWRQKCAWFRYGIALSAIWASSPDSHAPLTCRILLCP